MIDWHTHILPGIDDGSHDVDESVKMLDMLALQGIKTVIATPHFLADNELVDEFLERRKNAFCKLKPCLKPEQPEILLGAEVKYYQGISRLDGLQRLCIEGTSLLLLEMPMARWTEYTVREIEELASSQKVTLILAHIERYIKLQTSEIMERLYESGVMMQVNASFFRGYFSKKLAFSMLKNNSVHFIGSDCHNTKSRPPKIGEAFDVISAKLGQEFFNEFNEFGKAVLVENKIG